MRTKVYGKRARIPPDGTFDVFTRESPKGLVEPDKQGERERTHTLIDRPPEPSKLLVEVDSQIQQRKIEVLKKRPTESPKALVKPVKKSEQQRKELSKEGPRESLTGMVEVKNPVEQTQREVLRERPRNVAEGIRRPGKRDRGNIEAEKDSRAVYTTDRFVKSQTRSRRKNAINQPAADSDPGLQINNCSQERPTREDTDDLALLLQQKLLIAGSGQEKTKDLGSSKVSPSTLIPTFQQCSATLDVETASYIAPLLACKNVSPLVENFQAWTTERMSLLSMHKIGEGSFGEVYRATSNSETVIMKVIPLNARKGPGSRMYTSVESAANEIQLLEKMQKIPGFVEFRGACVLYGAMPSQLIEEWNSYKAQGRTVESNDPNKKNAYSEKQLWLLIEMSDAGTNLEPGYYRPPGVEGCVLEDRYLSVQRTWDIFWQIVRALAKAELYAEFEHRDLHLGNICAKDTCSRPDTENLTLVPSDESTPLTLDHTGIQVTIIDYSLSRALTDGGRILFYDFKNNKDILLGEGDLQYDIYRYMAAALEEDSCQSFVPKTNVLWLSYLLEKLLKVTVELSDKAKMQTDGFVTGTARMKGILTDLQCSLLLNKRIEWDLRSAGDVLNLGILSNWFESDEIINQ